MFVEYPLRTGMEKYRSLRWVMKLRNESTNFKVTSQLRHRNNIETGSAAQRGTLSLGVDCRTMVARHSTELGIWLYRRFPYQA